MSGSPKRNQFSAPTHYGRPDLAGTLLKALESAGKDIQNLAPDDLAPFDNLHVRGRAGTHGLARLAGLRPGTRVLDVGCGIGGPARTLAAEYGCLVTGIDLTESYVEAGRELTERVGLSESVSIHVGNAVELPIVDGSFDVVWMQHVGMNVADKARLYSECRRVLRPGGKLALHEIVAGTKSPLRYSVPWASDPSASFLLSPDRLRETLDESGLSRVEWRDDTSNSIEWAKSPGDAGGPEGLPGALEALLGPDYRERLQNVRRNLIERRIEVVQAVCTSP